MRLRGGRRGRGPSGLVCGWRGCPPLFFATTGLTETCTARAQTRTSSRRGTRTCDDRPRAQTHSKRADGLRVDGAPREDSSCAGMAPSHRHSTRVLLRAHGARARKCSTRERQSERGGARTCEGTAPSSRHSSTRLRHGTAQSIVSDPHKFGRSLSICGLTLLFLA